MGITRIRAIALLLRHEPFAKEIPNDENSDGQDAQTSYGASDYWTNVG